MSKNLEFVKFDKVNKSYDGKVLVVKGLQLNISEGMFISMLGPFGLRKTTCLILLSTITLVKAELLKRRSERLRGINS